MSPAFAVRATVLFVSLAFAAPGRSQEPEPLPLPAPSSKPKLTTESGPRVVVLDKGPVHEGFAQPGAQTRGKGVTAPKAPPAPVDEIPPQKTAEGVKWLPGYWHWDAERKDYIWLCGCYRNVPADRTWEPGRWRAASGMWTYFPGYWRPSDKALAANLPEPPAPKEEIPVAPKENLNAMWVPGVWEYTAGKFEWQPGYWPPGHGSMIWQQAQYVVTESGFAFVPGHWDYPLEERGLLFAPVYFSQAQREKRGWSYRPERAVLFGSESKWGEGGAFELLCIGPNYNSYHFGDYAQWRNAGTQPREVPVVAFMPGLADPIIILKQSNAYLPWDAVSPGYTNPLRQHYTRLNRSDSGLARGVLVPEGAKSAGGKNPLAFVEGGGCAHSCAPAPRVQWVATPVISSGYRLRR